jgi:hypothetical protein
MAIASSGEVTWVEEQYAFKHVGSADAGNAGAGRISRPGIGARTLKPWTISSDPPIVN